jgi:hypothetical protein
MPAFVQKHVPANVRHFKFTVFDGQSKASILGFYVGPRLFEGRGVAYTDEALVLSGFLRALRG